MHPTYRRYVGKAKINAVRATLRTHNRRVEQCTRQTRVELDTFLAWLNDPSVQRQMNEQYLRACMADYRTHPAWDGQE